jgi:hypothetical protein
MVQPAALIPISGSLTSPLTNSGGGPVGYAVGHAMPSNSLMMTADLSRTSYPCVARA